MTRDIDATAAQALDAALKIIEAEYPLDWETRQACATRVADCLRAHAFVRHDSEDFASRPRW